ncbi:acetyl-CoA carboxylase biotin carboxyl carrier protein [Modestobacter versicolor]|uniref:acetyl-CoA carboxylase biotin carboxyl carrier protein n=1 Tax=Modestobacter versicolor TaxID=429133 RepID=UPI0034E0304D
MTDLAVPADDVATVVRLQPVVEHLGRTVRELGLQEVVVRLGAEEGGGARLELHLRAGGGAVGGPVHADGRATPAPAALDPSPAAPVAEGPPAGAPATAGEPGAVVVAAPLVGVFYRRPTPDEPVFVEVGAEVAVGDPIGIVEAMKMMNQVPATVAGTVLAVHVPDSEIVEYGQSLVSIRPHPVAP